MELLKSIGVTRWGGNPDGHDGRPLFRASVGGSGFHAGIAKALLSPSFAVSVNRNYNQYMATWDERKRLRNIKVHGIDFVGCEAIWDNFTVTREDIRQHYDEQNAWSPSDASRARSSCWSIRNIAEASTSFPCEGQKSMKRATTLQKPKSFRTKAKDADNPPWSEEMLGPPVVKRGRGPQRTPTKVQTTLRLDADVLAYFRATGPGYQTQINEELRKVIKRGLTTRSSGRRSA